MIKRRHKREVLSAKIVNVGVFHQPLGKLSRLRPPVILFPFMEQTGSVDLSNQPCLPDASSHPPLENSSRCFSRSFPFGLLTGGKGQYPAGCKDTARATGWLQSAKPARMPRGGQHLSTDMLRTVTASSMCDF